MKSSAIISCLILLFAAFALCLPDDASAARMGGGKSFGSRSSMSSPAKAPSQNMGQSQAPAQRNAAAQPSKPGLFGGMGGFLGGMLAGTLLGSLLGGHGFAGGGFMDIILLGLLAFLGYKLYSRFKASKQQPAGASYDSGQGMNDQNNMQGGYAGQAGSAWGNLGSQSDANQPEAANGQIPADFDTEEFLRGAKLAYSRMQASWDKRDINDIAQFATQPVIDMLKSQMASDPTPSKTEIILVNAQLLEVTSEGTVERAQVYFDVLMRERPDQATPNSAREIWHFMRENAGDSWKLDGIQQVEG